MADDEIFREPDERTGPAVLDREPMLFPEQRKEAVERGKEGIDEVRRKLRNL